MASSSWEVQALSGKQIVKRRRLLREPNGDSDSDIERSGLAHLTTLVTALTENVLNMKTKDISGRVSSEVVPVFNPEDKNQNVEMWLKKIDELKYVYGWSERTTIFHATTRLGGLANTWYRSLPTIDFSWEDWKIQFQEAFPVETAYDQQLEQMLRRTKRRDESMINYFYEKLGLLNGCEIYGRKAIACIIGGIPDNTIKVAAKVKDFEQPKDLLRFLKTLTEEGHKIIPFSRKELPAPRLNNPLPKRKCYGCGSRNHILPQCPDKMSSNERRNQNKENTKSTKQILTLQEADDTGNKYFKKAYINGVCMSVYIDFGATCNVMKKDIFEKLKMNHDNKNQCIRGYGGSIVKALGVVKDVLVKIDEVEVETDFLIVPSGSQKISAIIGQPFTEQEHIVIYKDANNLHILNKDILPFAIDNYPRKTKIRLEKTTIVPPKHSMNLICTAKQNGIFYIETSLRLRENNEYCVPRCIVKTNSEGKCVVPVINATNNEVLIKSNRIFARAINCDTNKDIIMKLENGKREDTNQQFKTIKIGNTLTSQEVKELHNFLHRYESCFAASLGEIGCTEAAELHIDLVDEKAVVYRKIG